MKRLMAILLILITPMYIQSETSTYIPGLTVTIYPFEVIEGEGMEAMGSQIKNFLDSAVVFAGYAVLQPEETANARVDYELTGEIEAIENDFYIRYSINETVMPNLSAEGQEELLMKLTEVVIGLNEFASRDWADSRRKLHEMNRLSNIGEATRGINPNQMISFPAGSYQMGSPHGYEDERPAHPVHVDAFSIDKYEVTVGQYAAFLNEMGDSEQEIADWIRFNEYSLIEKEDGKWQPKEGYELYPVTNISWFGARAYCRYNQKRLPTEQEWEYAARGRSGDNNTDVLQQPYPWGEQWQSHRSCNLESSVKRELRAAVGAWDPAKSTLLPVGMFEPTGKGVCDMLGNAWEWTDGFYSEYPNPLSTIGEDGSKYKYDRSTRVLRGGSYGNYGYNQRVSIRLPSPPQIVNEMRGFRCAR